MRIHLIRGMSNSYLVDDGTLIDAGAKPAAVLAKAREAGINIKAIIITHYHVDHVRYARDLKRETGAEVIAPALDADVIRGKARPRAPNPLVAAFMALAKAPGVDVDREVMDGEEIMGYRAIHMPGHTPGSTAYLKEDALFSGDAVVERGGGAALPPKMFSLDINEARRSLAKLAGLGISTIYPGHGDPFPAASLSKLIVK
ncbi:MBL fold metallo-hydrolase [Thermocladium modestius]|uniref:MBL fold metallo-hydrolase n=1 Tax=Thermocladium modestius TaxID=62609 RepID=UPI00166D5C8C|nr:MBL fold metallo-hydrolase [Thermocladium modestius]